MSVSARGGFGVVHLARDTELGRDLAIKFLKPEFLTREHIVQRFLQEARAAAKIGHPGIVTVFDCGLVSGTGRSDGTAYIAMERLQGESLGDRISSKKLVPVASVIAIVRQLAAALHAAHDAGIIHRDLKPDNVFLLPDAAVVGGERAKILDFGIAKLADPGPGGVHTHSQMILGTPRYMAPEQARSSANVDARSDIYALGCILYEMICGRAPFEGDTGDVMFQHQTAQPVPPRDLMDNVPEPLDTLVMAMLEKLPDDRPSSMREIENALAACAVVPQASVILDPVPREKPRFVRRPVVTGVVEPPPPDKPRARFELDDSVDTPAIVPVPPRPRPEPKVASGSIVADSKAPQARPIAADDERNHETLADSTFGTRRLPWSLIAGVAGGVVLILAIVAVATRGNAADIPVVDAGVASAVVEPPPKRDDSADTQRWILTQCETARADRNWNALEGCGSSLIPHARPLGEKYVAIAQREGAAARRMASLVEAKQALDLDRARSHLAAIPAESMYLGDAKTAIAELELATMERSVASLDKLAAARNCAEHELLLEATETARPEFAVAIRATAKRCVPRGATTTTTTSTPDDVVVIEDEPARPTKLCSDPRAVAVVETKGDQAMNNASFAQALGHFEQVMRCKNVLTKTYLAACRAKNFPKAKVYFKLLGKASYAQICMKEGYDPR
ncbi:MAG: serine/threonine protein kinase [Deltaproteobacteria bacterium]|nr:serine/threonine protein kinase [Deltaproteobacteria bacterium]